MEGTIGEIRIFAGNFAPKNWSICDGTTIAIRSNTALFSILGTTYGGDGQTTFQLPDLRGKVFVGQGQGPGLSEYVLGEQAGAETHTLQVTEMPAHTHPISASGGLLKVSSEAATLSAPTTGSAIAKPGYLKNGNFVNTLGYSAETPTPLLSNTVDANGAAYTLGNTGGNVPHENIQPYLGLNYIICMFGVFPFRE